MKSHPISFAARTMQTSSKLCGITGLIMTLLIALALILRAAEVLDEGFSIRHTLRNHFHDLCIFVLAL